jgi:septum site-determining protein MinD
MTLIVGVISGKGGTGKTTTTINLAAALQKKGYNAFVVDGNLTTPNVSLHLGIPLYPVTLHDVIRGSAEIDEAIYKHPSGVGIVPASLAVDDMKSFNFERYRSAIHGIVAKRGIVLVDGAAGLGRETKAVLGVCDAAIVVTNPELPAVTDALKAVKVAKKARVPLMGVVVNRRKGLGHEMSRHDILAMLELPILGTIHEDINVPRSINEKTPVVHFSPRSRSARCFNQLASNFMGEEYHDEEPGVLDAMMNWLRG